MKLQILICLFAAFTLSGADDNVSVTYSGRLGTFYLRNDDSGENKFTVTSPLAAADIKDSLFNVEVYYNNTNTLFLKGQNKTFKKPGDFNDVLSIKEIRPSEKSIASEVLKFYIMKTKGIKTTVFRTALITLPLLDVLDDGKRGEHVTIKQSPACRADLDVQYPLTFPALTAKCGIWFVEKGKTEDKGAYTDVDGYVFASTDNNTKWEDTEKDSKDRIGKTLKVELKLTGLEGVKGIHDLKKYVKCSLNYGKSPYRVTYTPILVENEADACGANKVDQIVMTNSNMHLGFHYSVQSCYMKQQVNINSEFTCDDKVESVGKLSSRCEDAGVNKTGKVYTYSYKGSPFKPFNKAAVEKIVNLCYTDPKTLKVGEVVVTGAENGFVIKDAPEVSISTSFTIDKKDVKRDLNATVTIYQDGKATFTEVVFINATAVKAKYESAKHSLNITKQSSYYASVKLGDVYIKKSGKAVAVSVIDIVPSTDVTNVHVDGKDCMVKINEVSRSFAKPALFAFCGVWEADSVKEYESGTWLEKPDSKNASKGLSFSSKRAKDWIKEEDAAKHIKWTLKNKSIAIGLLDNAKPKWLRCDHFVEDKDGKSVATFSSIKERIITQNKADSCPANPLETFDAKKYKVKFIVNSEDTSCFKAPKVKSSMTAACTVSRKFYNVDCVNGGYIVKSPSKPKGEAYKQKAMEQYLKDCSSGTMISSSAILLTITAIYALFNKN